MLLYNVSKVIFDCIVGVCFLIIVVVYIIVYFQIRRLSIHRAETFRTFSQQQVGDDHDVVDPLGDDDDEDERQNNHDTVGQDNQESRCKY